MSQIICKKNCQTYTNGKLQWVNQFSMNPYVLFESLEGKRGESFGWMRIEEKIKKSLTKKNESLFF